MKINFNQTGNNTACAINTYCSAKSVSTGTTVALQAWYQAVLNTTTHGVIIGASETNVISVMWECIMVLPNISWNAGNWTVNLDVNVANANVTWVGLDICRISSGCVSQASIATQSLSINLGTTGVKSTTVTGVAQNPSAGDKVVVLLSFTNSAATLQSWTVNSDQPIVSPFALYAFRNIPFRRNHR